MRGKKSGVAPLPIRDLEHLSVELRRRLITMIYQSGTGHPAGSLSCLDILIALYFGGILKYDPKRLEWPVFTFCWSLCSCTIYGSCSSWLFPNR